MGSNFADIFPTSKRGSNTSGAQVCWQAAAGFSKDDPQAKYRRKSAIVPFR